MNYMTAINKFKTVEVNDHKIASRAKTPTNKSGSNFALFTHGRTKVDIQTQNMCYNLHSEETTQNKVSTDINSVKNRIFEKKKSES